MMEDNIIDNYSTAIFLRHLRGTTPTVSGTPRLDIDRELEFLHFHWSISGPIRQLAEYLLENRHETQSLLSTRNRMDDGIAHGRIDTRTTLLYRLRSGLPTAIISAEPVRTYASGPNQVLAWVFNQSKQIAFRFSSVYQLGPAYLERLTSFLHLLDQVRRMEVIRNIHGDIAMIRRPLPASLLAAQRSRRKLYRLAYDAYQVYIEIERGDQKTIASMLRETLLIPLENWRRLELAIALGIGEALAEITKKPLLLELLGMQERAPILRCGPYSVYWQTLTDLYRTPVPEPSEELATIMLKAYGLGNSSDRPDLLVINEETRELISIIEVKYHAGDNPSSRFREAIHQIIRYSRGYNGDQETIIGRSAVAMNASVPVQKDATVNTPFAFSFNDILQGNLTSWIRTKWLT